MANQNLPLCTVVKKGKRIAFLSLGTRLQKILEVSELIKKNYKFFLQPFRHDQKQKVIY